MPRIFLATSVPERFSDAVKSVAQSRAQPVSVLLRNLLADLLREEGVDVAALWEPRRGGRAVRP
jgi:hypothetical protein